MGGGSEALPESGVRP